MRLLLLGANGQLGSDILAINTKLERPHTIELLPRSALDVAQAAAIAPALEPLSFDAVVNCTSYHKTDEVEREGGRAVAVNCAAPKILAEICAQKRARFVHISTDYVFGGYIPAVPLRETDPAAPVNVYGATKLLGENLAFAAHKDTLVLRVASLFGVAGASGKGGNFVETMIRFGRERGELRVVADQTMSPTSTADIASWIFKLLERQAPAGIYHAVNSGAATWFHFARTIIAKTGVAATVHPIPSSDYATPAMRPPFSALDNRKLEAFVGSIRNWEEALDDYLESKGHLH